MNTSKCAAAHWSQASSRRRIVSFLSFQWPNLEVYVTKPRELMQTGRRDMAMPARE